ncbi:MAG: DNA cytosine methyltransferase [Ruminococcus flavefaciens]|nr:DNA cytosine methyltransferase [Ruminococcus flavefaciens]
MNKQFTLGSLFDGSGTFPVTAILSGIRPVWASEIESFCIRVTTKRLPFIKHLGDINNINGAEIPPVDVITFGSPCTDLSIAGKRAGLNAERSGLFFQAVRIIKEMRCATNGEYPRFIVWENVCGAFSSNGGEDFRTVLEEICKIKDSAISVPRPEKWTKSGEIVGDGFSVAYRTLDAQYWGVPQRRKRIYLVADFGGERAGEILFESEGLSGYSAEGFRTWQRVTRNAENCFEMSGASLMFENHSQDTRYTGPLETAPTVLSSYGSGGNNQPFVVKNQAVTFSQDTYTKYTENSQSGTLRACGGICGGGSEALVCPSDKKYTVRRLTPQECALLQGMPTWWCDGLETDNPTDEEISCWYDVFETHRKAVNPDKKPRSHRQVEKWLKNPYSDSSAYKMWGNGIAMPCAWFVLAGIAYYALRADF